MVSGICNLYFALQVETPICFCHGVIICVRILFFFFHLGVGNSNNHLNHPLRDFFIKLDQKVLTVSCQLPSCVWRRGVFCHNWSSKSLIISTLISYGCVLIQESDSFYLCLCHIHHVAFMSL